MYVKCEGAWSSPCEQYYPPCQCPRTCCTAASACCSCLRSNNQNLWWLAGVRVGLPTVSDRRMFCLALPRNANENNLTGKRLFRCDSISSSYRHVDGSAYWRCISANGKFSAYFKISQRQNLQTVHLYSGKRREKTTFSHWKTGLKQ